MASFYSKPLVLEGSSIERWQIIEELPGETFVLFTTESGRTPHIDQRVQEVVEFLNGQKRYEF
jgi:hypothetical protein